jgi:hypothetical protein
MRATAATRRAATQLSKADNPRITHIVSVFRIPPVSPPRRIQASAPSFAKRRTVDQKALIRFMPTASAGSNSVGSIQTAREVQKMGLIELLLVVLVIAAIAGGIGVSPLLWLLLLVVVVIMLTSGGFGYRRGGRI